MRRSTPLGDYMPLAAPLNGGDPRSNPRDAAAELPSTYQQIELINLSDAVQCIDKSASLFLLLLFFSVPSCQSCQLGSSAIQLRRFLFLAFPMVFSVLQLFCLSSVYCVFEIPTVVPPVMALLKSLCADGHSFLAYLGARIS